MPDYDLRSIFPLNDREFGSPEGIWICRLAEVSDLRPGEDRLSWFLVFERKPAREHRAEPLIRKLEILTSASHLIENGFPPELENRLENWILSGDQAGRLKWSEY
jgi:hypothetical protein